MTGKGKIPLIGIDRLRMGIDGTGVRTLIGTAGCPLRCRYCLNPHSWNGKGAVTNYTPEQLYEAVRIDNLYFQATGGGVTFGGGEPLMHMEAIAEFAALCPESWNFWAETSLQVREDQIRLAAEVFDYFLVDIKSADPEIYRAYTAGDGQRALDNLKLLLTLAGPERITVRLPRIPGYADEAALQESARTLREKGVADLDYLTYWTDAADL